MNLPVISISLVQGDALGGGFECALADDLIIAEKSTKQFRLAECLFSLFPGMGQPTCKISASIAGEDGLQRRDLHCRRDA